MHNSLTKYKWLTKYLQIIGAVPKSLQSLSDVLKPGVSAERWIIQHSCLHKHDHSLFLQKRHIIYERDIVINIYIHKCETFPKDRLIESPMTELDEFTTYESIIISTYQVRSEDGNVIEDSLFIYMRSFQNFLTDLIECYRLAFAVYKDSIITVRFDRLTANFEDARWIVSFK